MKWSGIKPKEESSSFAGTAMVHEGKSFYIDEEMWGKQQNVVQWYKNWFTMGRVTHIISGILCVDTL